MVLLGGPPNVLRRLLFVCFLDTTAVECPPRVLPPPPLPLPPFVPRHVNIIMQMSYKIFTFCSSFRETDK